MKQAIARLLAAMVPFKGSNLYESQIGPVVIQWGHSEPWSKNGIAGTPLHIWHDSCWRDWLTV